MNLVEWWIELPGWLKYGVALLVLGVTRCLYLGGIFWPWGLAVGLVLLFFAIALG